MPSGAGALSISRLIGVGLLIASFGWILFALTLSDGSDASDEGVPTPRTVTSALGLPRVLKPRRSPGPVVKAAQRE
jgi:hypothetical protein